jgi:glutathione S-transferase
MRLQLYYSPIACSMVPYINLAEADAKFEVVPVNFRIGAHMTPEYLAINPLHKVPVLAVDGRPLTENVAINTFIARQFPAARLLPADPMDEIVAISRMSWLASGVHPHLSRINAPLKFCDTPGSEAATRRLAAAFTAENFRAADSLLKDREFFFDHFTAVDAHFFWCVRRATQYDLPLGEYPNLLAHFDRMKQRRSVQRVLAYEKETEKALGWV